MQIRGAAFKQWQHSAVLPGVRVEISDTHQPRAQLDDTHGARARAQAHASASAWLSHKMRSTRADPARGRRRLAAAGAVNAAAVPVAVPLSR